MKKNISIFSILVLSVIFSVGIISTAAAQDNGTTSDAFSNLTYPIAELGNCKDRADCKIYCDDPANTVACVNYAEKKNLLSAEDLQIAKNFIASGSKGPGNCNGKAECQAYCEDKSHIDECISYAEDKGLMSSQDLQKAKKVQTAIKNGVKFPACQTKKECDAYCEESAHMEECITFAKEAGLLSETELQNSQKVLTAVKQGTKLLPCKGKEACDTYCANASHAEECVNFAVAAGIVTSDEAKIIKETGGKGPGGCKNKSECDSYCSNDANKEACMSFAQAHNIPQPQPPQQPGQSGQPQQPGQPGQLPQKPTDPSKCIADCDTVGKNCMSDLVQPSKDCAAAGQYCRNHCDAFDTNGDHQISSDEFNRCNDTQCTPTETSCFAKITAADSNCRTTMDVCEMNCQKASKPAKPTKPTQPNQPTQPTQPGQPLQPNQPSQPGQPGQNPPTFSKPGPGGCKTVEECKVYCQSHPEAKAECQAFKQSQKPAQPSQPSGPAGN